MICLLQILLFPFFSILSQIKVLTGAELFSFKMDNMVLNWKKCFTSLTNLLTIPLKSKRHLVLKKLACNRVSEKCELEETMTNQLSHIICRTVYHAYFVKSSFSENAAGLFQQRRAIARARAHTRAKMFRRVINRTRK